MIVVNPLRSSLLNPATKVVKERTANLVALLVKLLVVV